MGKMAGLLSFLLWDCGSCGEALYALNVGVDDRQPNQTRVTSYIQTDLAGLLPTALVDQALPSNQINFFTSLRAALADHRVTN